MLLNPSEISKDCLVCGKKFKTRRAYHEKGIGNYCTSKCRGLAHRGKRLGTPLKGENNPSWKGGLSGTQSTQAYRKKYPKKVKAQRQLQNAVKRGRIIKKPCEKCGDTKSQGHHCDYNKPFEVMWLCQKHHSQWHKKNGEGKNA